MPPQLFIHPPLLNSASPWATSLSHLRLLLQSPSTGAITTRTSLLSGFNHQPSSHRYALFNPTTTNPSASSHSIPDTDNNNYNDDALLPLLAPDRNNNNNHPASLNTLGYSPLTLIQYLDTLRSLSTDLPTITKTVIISVTGSPTDISTCYSTILSYSPHIHFHLAVEINLSCPNIFNLPPPAYHPDSLHAYLSALPPNPEIPIGIKTPPYTHSGQYSSLLSTLLSAGAGQRLSFITAVNTLGSCLILNEEYDPVLPSAAGSAAVHGIGGMAGPPLHPLALGNVATIRALLDSDESLRHITIIGVGGVGDGQGYRRMRAAGANFVALATALGHQGISVFQRIQDDIGSAW